MLDKTKFTSEDRQFGKPNGNQRNVGGGWDKERSIPYQYQLMMRMSTSELAAWAKANEKTMTVAQAIVLNRLKAALKSLPDAKEVTDRTSGKSVQAIDISADLDFQQQLNSQQQKYDL